MFGLDTIVRMNEHAANQAANGQPERKALALTLENKPLEPGELETIQFPSQTVNRCA